MEMITEEQTQTGKDAIPTWSVTEARSSDRKGCTSPDFYANLCANYCGTNEVRKKQIIREPSSTVLWNDIDPSQHNKENVYDWRERVAVLLGCLNHSFYCIPSDGIVESPHTLIFQPPVTPLFAPK